jgi:multidrug transporter EmrE-like cation transporter
MRESDWSSDVCSSDLLYPMVSLGYIWTLLWSRLFFKEAMTRSKLVGVGMVLTGIVLLSLGGR